MSKFTMTALVQPYDIADTARIGAGTGASNNVDDKEVGKLHKLGGDSRYVLCAAGDEIEGQLVAVESATADGYTMGSIQKKGRMDVVLDGLQATPGTGVIAIGEYVVCGTVVAKGTALTAAPKVCKATTQADVKNGPFAWRLVSASSTAVGATGVIERA